MRLLHTFDDQRIAINFSAFLSREGIENQCDVIANTDWGSSDYGTVKCNLWVVDEDQMETAQRWLEELQQQPENPLFQDIAKWNAYSTTQQPTPVVEERITSNHVKITLPKRPPQNKALGIITLYLLMSCTLLFLYGEFTAPPIELPVPQLPLTPLYSPPINKMLFYDYPQAYEILDKLARAYGLQKLQNLSDLPQEGQLLVQKFEHTPYWKGFYDKIVDYFTHPGQSLQIEAPLFEKIKQGEVWRLFSPALLHLNVFHLFFNMIWLVILGKMVEEKIGAMRYLVLILIIAALSNTAQYLMSGANFIGISGVICGMLGFIWARQQVAVWEGYNLMPGVISFMFFFVMAMFIIQLISFILQVYFKLSFMPAIANTAHIVGGLVGYLLGRLNVFALTSAGGSKS